MKLQEIFDYFDTQEETTSLYIKNVFNKLPVVKMTDEEAQGIYFVIQNRLGKLSNCETIYDDETMGMDAVKVILKQNIVNLTVEIRNILKAIDNDVATSHQQTKFNPIDNDNINNAPINMDNITFNYVNNMIAQCDYLAENSKTLGYLYTEFANICYITGTKQKQKIDPYVNQYATKTELATETVERISTDEAIIEKATEIATELQDQINEKVSKTGDTMSGDLVLSNSNIDFTTTEDTKFEGLFFVNKNDDKYWALSIKHTPGQDSDAYFQYTNSNDTKIVNIPKKSGTVALTSDIPHLYVHNLHLYGENADDSEECNIYIHCLSTTNEVITTSNVWNYLQIIEDKKYIASGYIWSSTSPKYRPILYVAGSTATQLVVGYTKTDDAWATSFLINTTTLKNVVDYIEQIF